MSQLTALRNANTLGDLAAILGYKPAALSYILYVLPHPDKYQTFEIPKRSGGTRKICAPTTKLKLLQRRIADLLYNCIEEIKDSSNHKDTVSHAFKKNHSIITNARRHRNKRYVFNVDLEDFFGSINFGRVRGYFITDKDFSVKPAIATILAQIACHDNSLPQGSPCSPIISDLIGRILDIRLVRLAKKHGCTYTRYADDITFSTNKKTFPHQIATKHNSATHKFFTGNNLTKIIENCGFTINNNKTRMQYRDSRQEVTGLIVNKKINVRKEYRHTVRAMTHRLFTTGEFHFEHWKKDDKGNLTLQKEQGRITQLHGMLGFIDGIDIYNKTTNTHNKPSSLSSKELMYRRFLMYKEFYSTSSPVLLCEGKTDNVYITHAIRSLASEYPKLATIDSDRNISIKIKRFRYTDNSTGRILGIHGGSTNLITFIRNYRSDVKKFHSQGMRSPIIILIDNDSGAKPVYSYIKEIIHTAPDRTEPFIHLFNNLYIVATPLSDGNDTSIEDFFEDEVKKTILNGKKFNPSNNYNSKLEYGKADFAYKVVLPHSSAINFAKFRSILDRFVCVIDEHEKKHQTEQGNQVTAN